MSVIEELTAPSSARTETTGGALPPASGGRPPARHAWRPLDRVRVGVALVGLGCVATAEGLLPGAGQEIVSTVGVVALAVAAALLLVRSPTRATVSPESATSDDEVPHPVAPGPAASAPTRAPRRAWRWSLLGVTLAEGLLVQTWFRAGTAIAGGDIGPPLGTAWITRLFAPIAWSGADLGGPNQSEHKLPWAVVVWLTHLAGGSGALAQRIWLTALLAAVPLAAAALARALGLSPLAGIAAALLYAFSPYLVSIGGVSDVYLVATVLLAALPALVVAAGRGTVPTWAAALGLLLAAPLLGYAYANPPLVGMIGGVLVLSPGLAWARYGRRAGIRSTWALLIGGALLVGGSAYWAIPAKTGLAQVATSSLSPLAAWRFTEVRATLANALWLNTSWAWRYTYYVPYAPDFARLPLVLLRPLVPLVAFGALALGPLHREWPGVTRVTALVALATLGIMTFSTGTRSPGNVLFDPLYSLPYGWLLREPGRFLIAAALGVALLGALLVEHLRSVPIRHPPLLLRRGTVAQQAPIVGLLGLGAVVLIALTSFPLWSGRVVPGPRPPFPSSHVKVPAYWNAMATYLNARAAPSGHLLALPPESSIYIPFSWYYGNDAFVAQLLRRPVVDPSGQGYDVVSSELSSASQLEAEALVARDWTEARHLLGALGTPLVLVEGDVETPFPGHSIISPALLAARLDADPLMRPLRRFGPLQLFAVRRTLGPPSNFATVNTATPDLRALALLPRSTAMLTSQPLPGHLALFQLPPVATWSLGSAHLSTALAELPGRHYVPAVLGLSPTGRVPTGDLRWRTSRPVGRAPRLTLSLPVGPSLIRDGSFATGPWGPVGNCNDAHPVVAPQFVSDSVLPLAGPSRSPALRLAADTDGACEAQGLSWHGGSVLLRLSVRSITGAPAEVCLWEQPEDRCAAAPPLPQAAGWERYRAVLTPAVGTRRLSIYLYAFSTVPGQTTVSEFANIVVRSLPAAPQVDVLAQAEHAGARASLLTGSTGFGPGWGYRGGGRHVEVDGLRNGWIVAGPREPAVVATVYAPVLGERRKELLLGGICLGAALSLAVLRRRRERGTDLAAAESRGVR